MFGQGSGFGRGSRVGFLEGGAERSDGSRAQATFNRVSISIEIIFSEVSGITSGDSKQFTGPKAKGTSEVPYELDETDRVSLDGEWSVGVRAVRRSSNRGSHLFNLIIEMPRGKDFREYLRV
jgi:hypothetical protein